MEASAASRPSGTVAKVAALLGGAGSVACTILAGRGSPLLVHTLIVLWVASPFAALLAASSLAPPGGRVRAALDVWTALLAVLSLLLYGVRLVRPLGSHPASVFIGWPLLSWALSGAVLWVFARGGRRPGQANG